MEQEKDWGGEVKITNRKIQLSTANGWTRHQQQWLRKGFEVIRDALTAQSINFSDDLNFLQPNF